MFPYYKMKISQILNVHTHDTRNKENYRTTERARLRIIQRAYLYKGIDIWNSLDSWKRDYCSLSGFKKKMKSHLINNL